VLIGDADVSSDCLANPMAEATSDTSDGAIRCLGGTTTVGPELMSASLEASMELSRRANLVADVGSWIDVAIFVKL
jgi:hypothetical protein